jgi:EAL domain-containing protein (putative c-di-GMP-specific phosphodiesterase class I)
MSMMNSMPKFQVKPEKRLQERDLAAELEREKELRRQKDIFLNAASHHINNPLAALVGFSEILRDRSRDLSAGVRNEIIELLAIQANETAQVVADLLLAARFDLADMEVETAAVDLRTVVEKATHDWASLHRARLTVSGNAVADADGHWVTQVVGNLLRNAVAFGGDNIWVRIGEGFNKVVVEVVDDGEGVPPEDVERLFQAYHSERQSDRLLPSLGLGLSVARRLAQAMNGDVRYLREDGETIFELSLPQVKVDFDSFSDSMDVVIDPQAGRPTKAAINEVLADGGPEMVYQQVVDIGLHRSGEERIVGYESLARFPYSTPPQWFEIAGSSGLRLDLELSAMRKAIDGFAPSNHDGFLALNLSDSSLTSSRLLDALTGLDPGRIVLELSEVAVIKSYEVTKRFVDSLRDRGIRLAVDDVGAGEIDLWHILRLEPAVVKVDLCLVRDIEHTPRNRALIRGIAAMAQDLGIMVVAEGIEAPEEEEVLLELGVQYGQGYLFGKPRPLQWKTKVLSD